MTLTKTNLAENVREKIHLKTQKKDRQQFLFPELNYDIFSKNRSRQLVESLFEIMKQTMEKGEHVLITGFGKFQVKFKWARKGRNPKTGEHLILNSRRIVTFKCSSRLKERLNREEEAP